MKNFYSSLLFILLIPFPAFCYDWLTVSDPRGWQSSQGSIDEANLTITPQGIYMEYELFLTFSAKNNYAGFTHSDTLEVTYGFDLPEGSIVHDLWLWFGTDTLKALIMDKWTASSIYENIVKRRRDPAILFKKESNSYELRIFPMAGDESRKVKLTYLVPVQWNTSIVSAPLPINMLKTSLAPLSQLSLVYNPNTDWTLPRISENQNIKFTEYQDSLSQVYLKAQIPLEGQLNLLHLEASSPLENGVFLSKLSNSIEGANEGLYQLAIYPRECFGLAVARKVAVLIDYDASKGTITTQEILANLRSLLKQGFTEKDSFNLIFSSLDIKRIRETWIPGDSASIESVFSSLGPNPISSYSNLPSLLNNGIDFVNKNGKDASLLLISNSDQVGDYQVANPLIRDLQDKMETSYPFYIYDFCQLPSYHYINDRYYYGNEYFFNNLSRLTGGEYQINRNNQAVSQGISLLLQSLSGLITSFDLYTTLQDGYCFGRLNVERTDVLYPNKPIAQVGKFSGNFPFIIKASGVFNSQTFSREIVINESEVFLSDTLAEEMWAGNYVKFLEGQTQTNSIINEIVDYSIAERVLSFYSAFIALEQLDSIVVCYDCFDDGGNTTAVEDTVMIPTDLKVEAFPNPFNSQVQLNVSIASDLNNTDVTFKIYNILGEVVKTFDSDVIESGNYKFQWNGINDYGESVSSGIYLFVVQTAKKNYSLKIILMK